MTSGGEDRAAVRVPPPLLFVASTVAGALLERRLPVGLEASTATAVGAGAALAAGVALIADALARLVRSGQHPEPWKPTPSIVDRGSYRHSRNPIYLGLALLQLAAGLWTASGWIILLLPVSVAAVQHWVIRHEEAYLLRRFGDDYRRYRRRVRRWL